MPPSNFLQKRIDSDSTTAQDIGGAPVIALIILAAMFLIAIVTLLVSKLVSRFRKKETTSFFKASQPASTARGHKSYTSDASINPLLYDHGNWQVEGEKTSSLSMYSQIAENIPQQSAKDDHTKVLVNLSRPESPRPPAPASVSTARITRATFSSPRTPDQDTSYKQVLLAEVPGRPLLTPLIIPENRPSQTSTSRQQMTEREDDSASSYSPTPAATTFKRSSTMSTYAPHAPSALNLQKQPSLSEDVDEETVAVSKLLRARAERTYAYAPPTREPSTVSRIEHAGSIKSISSFDGRHSHPRRYRLKKKVRPPVPTEVALA